jgi:hypothetical protein
MTLRRFSWSMIVMLFCFGLIVTLATPVLAQHPSDEDVLIGKEVIPAANTNSSQSSAEDGSVQSLRSASGESTMIKVNPFYGAVTIVYLQCGHIVGKLMPAGCGRSGVNWRYTTDCPKSDTIYVTLPCMRHKP